MGVGVLIAASCGWRLQPPPIPAVSLGHVQAASVEPGLQASLSAGLARGLLRGGVAAGPAVDVAVLDLRHAPDTATPESGLAVLHTTLLVSWQVGACDGEVSAQHRWTLPSGAASSVIGARAAVVEALAETCATRIVDAIVLRGPACR